MIIRGILDIKLYNGKITDIAGGLHNEMGREIRGLERKFTTDCGTIKKTYSSAGICFIQNSGTCQLIRRKKKCEKISERTHTFIRSRF